MGQGEGSEWPAALPLLVQASRAQTTHSMPWAKESSKRKGGMVRTKPN